jgi:hypothetical protein
MRLASYIARGRASFGAVVGDGVVDFRVRFGPRFATLVDLIRANVLDEVRASTISRTSSPFTVRVMERECSIMAVDVSPLVFNQNLIPTRRRFSPGRNGARPQRRHFGKTNSA